MIFLHRIASMLRWCFRRKNAEQELQDELQAFMDMSAAEKIASGSAPAEARRLAKLELGGLEQTKERIRTRRHGALLDELGRDLRYAFLIIAHKPRFRFISVLILASGIGANTVIFSLVNATNFKLLPVFEPERLVEIRSGTRRTFSNPFWEQIQSHPELFDGAIAYS